MCLAAALAVGCAQESDLPNPTGKGRVQAINGIPASPGIEFRIEERELATLSYKSASAGANYDDFEYQFNFDTVIDPLEGRTRIASVAQKVDVNRHYTFVLTGEVAAPDVMVWEGEQRVFDDGATVFQVQFAHLAESLGELDVYLAPQGTAPVVGAEIGSVAYGEILPPTDLTAEKKVLTVTARGDPTTVVYRTSAVTFNAATAYTLTLFDGDETDVSPQTVRFLTATGGSGVLTDTRYQSTIRLFHAAMSMAAADIYDDEALTSTLVTNQAFGQVSGDLPFSAAETDLTWTAAGNPSVVLFEETVDAASGTHNNLIVIETADDDDDPAGRFYVPDRRSVSTFARFSVFHAAADQEILDVYAVDADQPITEVLPRFRIGYGNLSTTLPLQAGSFDLYATEPATKTIVAGPARLVVADGDVVETLLLDTADPNAAVFSLVPAP